MSETKTGVELIAEERQRQIEVEKWDYNHDAAYKNGELVGAAGCYVANALNEDRSEPFARFQIIQRKESEFGYVVKTGKWIDGWPWDKEWDKRNKHDTLRSLVIAGALIAAEIDRLNSSHQPENKPQ